MKNRVVLYLEDEALAKLDAYRAELGNESRNAVLRAALRAFLKGKELCEKAEAALT